MDPPARRRALALLFPAALLLMAAFLLPHLGPVLAGAFAAYLLRGPVAALGRAGLPRLAAVAAVVGLLVVGALAALALALPLLWRQSLQLLSSLPGLLAQAEALLVDAMARYPDLVDEATAAELLAAARREAVARTQALLGASLPLLSTLLAAGVYAVVVPFVAFFLLKDGDRVAAWLRGLLPPPAWAGPLWQDLDARLGGYLRGKAYEVLIVWGVSALAFWLLGLRWALLLGLVTGLSALVPIFGALLATLPVALVAYGQWGAAPMTAWVLAAYAAIQAVDGNLLQPLLFSRTVGLHPLAVVAAVLALGGAFGLWGLLLAVPMASLGHVLLGHWQRLPGRAGG